MLGFSFGLKGMAISALVAFAIGSIGGMRVEKKLSDAIFFKAVNASLQKKVETLQDRIKTATDAAKNDQERAAEAEARRKQAEDKANELPARITDGSCFSADDAVQLRQLWAPVPARRPQGRPAAGPR